MHSMPDAPNDSLLRRSHLHPTATIVLPVYNRERTLRPEVLRILDLAEILHRRVVVVLVDDGSRDGTYETACELARQFPQVRVLRQPYQCGLGGALDQVRLRLGAEQVVAHDGIAAIDLDELAELLTAPEPLRSAAPTAPRETTAEPCGSRRFATPMSHHSRQPAAARGLRSFRWLRLDEPVKPRRIRGAHSPASNAVAAPAPIAVVPAPAFSSPAIFAN